MIRAVLLVLLAPVQASSKATSGCTGETGSCQMPPDVTSLVQTRATLAVGREEATATAPEGRDEDMTFDEDLMEALAQVRKRRTQEGQEMHPNEAAAYAMVENG